MLTNEGCTLEWQPPEDDGGCPIENYYIEKMDEETGKWVRSGHTASGDRRRFEVTGTCSWKEVSVPGSSSKQRRRIR